MASPSESASNGEKPAPTEDQAERGVAPSPKLKGSRFSSLSWGKRQPPEKVESKPAPAAKGAAPTSGIDSTILDKRLTLLRYAVAHGDCQRTQGLMAKLRDDGMLESAGFMTQDAAGNGLLQIAVLYGHIEVSELLLKNGFNINSVDRNHGTALQAAIYMGRNDIIDSLLNRRKSNTNLEAKAQLKVNTRGGYYGCALQVAAYRANSKLVKDLINDFKADVNVAGGKYGYPLQAAVRTGRRDVVDPILSNTDVNVNAVGGKYGTVLQAVARGPYRSRTILPEISRGRVLKQEAQSSPGHPIDLHNNATEADYIDVAEMLFGKHAKMHGGSGRLDNPINAAACSGSQTMLQLMLDGFPNRREDWKEDKRDVLTKALLSAITESPKNQLILVQKLRNAGARIDYQMSDSLPNLPLEAAATKNLLDVVNYLLDIGADPCSESGIHGTALRAAIAARHERIAQCLINHQARQYGIEKRSTVGPNTLSTNVTVDTGTNVPTELPSGMQGMAPSNDLQGAVDSSITPAAGSEEEYSSKRRRVQKGAEWICRDADYGNILQLSASRGLRSTVALLLDYGADPNVVDTSFRTSLHIASWFGFPEIVFLLLANGADIDAKDEWGATALDQAEESLDRDGHPGGTVADLQLIRQKLAEKLVEVSRDKPGMVFKGPKKFKLASEKQSSEATGAQEKPRTAKPASGGAESPGAVQYIRKAKPVFTMPSWNPGLGFRATIVDIWESDDEECLLWKQPKIDEILYYKAGLDAVMACKDKPQMSKNKVRWVHLPTNNMTWAEMLITSLCNQKGVPTPKNLWGSDPFYNSPDLSPHARFITPQCGRLVQEGQKVGEELNQPAPLFMAMPYIHWEADRSQKKVADWIEKVKNESRKTSGDRKNDLWPSEKDPQHPRQHSAATSHSGQSEHGMMKTANFDQIDLDTPEAEEEYRELLSRYLYKRRPVHLRRTLDQYFYSHLADTKFRDGDQVVMRQVNEEKKKLKMEADPKYIALRKIQETDCQIAKASPLSRIVEKVSTSRPMTLNEVSSQLRKIEQLPYRDDNSPVLMIDQLWLWLIDEKTIVTCFPHRQYDRDKFDLDATDKTDILKTIVTYLHSPRRPYIDSSQALAELIWCQCVGILHRADMNHMIPEVDFLKFYSIWSNKWADEVMQRLTDFDKKFKDFMSWIKRQPTESEKSITRFESLFDVTRYIHLLRNIQDIKDELGMLKAVFDDQVQVLTAAGEEIHLANSQYVGDRKAKLAAEQCLRCPHSSKGFVDQSLKQLKQVERMQTQANQAYDTLNDLLNLMQQQANVLEARVSRNQAISSGEQSKTILVFTIVTIIFLPLTFVTTVFTLPIAEFHRVVLPLGQDMPPTPFLHWSYIKPYIVGITFAVAVPLIIAAFEIQSMLNAGKLAWKEMTKKMTHKAKEKRKDEYVPDFLKQQDAGKL